MGSGNIPSQSSGKGPVLRPGGFGIDPSKLGSAKTGPSVSNQDSEKVANQLSTVAEQLKSAVPGPETSGNPASTEVVTNSNLSVNEGEQVDQNSTNTQKTTVMSENRTIFDGKTDIEVVDMFKQAPVPTATIEGTVDLTSNLTSKQEIVKFFEVYDIQISDDFATLLDNTSWGIGSTAGLLADGFNGLCDFLGYVGSNTVALVDQQANDPKSTFNTIKDGVVEQFTNPDSTLNTVKDGVVEQFTNPDSTFNYVVDGASWTIGKAHELGVTVGDYGNRFISGFNQGAADLFSTGADIVTQLSDENSQLRQDISQSIDGNITSMAECWDGVCKNVSDTTGTVFDSALSLLTFTGQVLASIDEGINYTGNSILKLLDDNFPDAPLPKDDAGDLIPTDNFTDNNWLDITNWCKDALNMIDPATYLADDQSMSDFVQDALESDPFKQSVLETVAGDVSIQSAYNLDEQLSFQAGVKDLVDSDQCKSFKTYYDDVKQDLEQIISELGSDDEPVTFKNKDGVDTPLTFEAMQGMTLGELQQLSVFDNTEITPLNFVFLTEGQKALDKLGDQTRDLSDRQKDFSIAKREVSLMPHHVVKEDSLDDAMAILKTRNRSDFYTLSSKLEGKTSYTDKDLDILRDVFWKNNISFMGYEG